MGFYTISNLKTKQVKTMSKRELLNPIQKQVIADKYKNKEATQEELAIEFEVSATTIRRTLYEFGLCTFNSEVTAKERSLLETIKQFNIKTVDQLRSVLAKGVQCQ